jgi:hypothetical protein
MPGAKTEGPLAQKMWALGLLVALVAAGLMLSAGPAHADTFTVDNTIDPGNGTCSATAGCTLREAITATNDAPGADAIDFDISGSGVRTIAPTSPLPEITGPVTIDGYTQPEASPNTLAEGTNAVILIELAGSTGVEGTSGLDIEASNVVVRGLAINRWVDGSGIFVSNGATRTTGVRIEGNFLGTDPAGTSDLGNRDNGVRIFEASGATVGGTTPEARNLISGNGSSGVLVGGGSGAIVGNKVLGNLIGTQKNGTSALGNSREGVGINGASGTTVGGTTSEAANTIAFNAEAGAAVEDDVSSGNRVLGNSIFSNSGLGIDLDDDGRTANDPRDRDAGPNRLQNFPVLTFAVFDGTTIVKGTLESTPSTRKKKRAFTVQLFSNPAADRDEGKTFVGQKRVTTNRRGKASFTFVTDRVVTGMITATATGPGGNTSEFSDPLGVATD